MFCLLSFCVPRNDLLLPTANSNREAKKANLDRISKDVFLFQNVRTGNCLCRPFCVIKKWNFYLERRFPSQDNGQIIGIDPSVFYLIYLPSLNLNTEPWNTDYFDFIFLFPIQRINWNCDSCSQLNLSKAQETTPGQEGSELTSNACDQRSFRFVEKMFCILVVHSVLTFNLISSTSSPST